MSETNGKSTIDKVVIPVAKLNSIKLYWWYCSRCNHKNEHGFIGDAPEFIKCQACRLNHEME